MPGRYEVPLPTAARRACGVCGQTLGPHAALSPRKGASSSALYPVCRDPGCRGVFEFTPGASEAEFARELDRRAKTFREGRAGMNRRAGLLRDRAPIEARENAEAFAVIGAREDLGPGPSMQLVLPSGHRPSRPLPRRSRRAYLAHLDAVIAEAFEAAETRGPSPADPPTPGPDEGGAGSSLPGRLCGACGGGCCVFATDNAFLSKQTILRVLAADPTLTPAQVRDLYLERLPPRSVAGSCPNHTRHGCALPRSLRADVCNGFACSQLKSLMEGLKADPPVRKVIVVRRRQSQWDEDNPLLENDIVGAAVLTEARSVRPRRPKPAEPA